MDPQRYAEVIRRLKDKIAETLNGQFIDNSEIKTDTDDNTLKITVDGHTFAIELKTPSY